MHLVLPAVITLWFTATMGALVRQGGGQPDMMDTNLPAGDWLNADEGWIEPSEGKDGGIPERVLDEDALETR